MEVQQTESNSTSGDTSRFRTSVRPWKAGQSEINNPLLSLASETRQATSILHLTSTTSYRSFESFNPPQPLVSPLPTLSMHVRACFRSQGHNTCLQPTFHWLSSDHFISFLSHLALRVLYSMPAQPIALQLAVQRLSGYFQAPILQQWSALQWHLSL